MRPAPALLVVSLGLTVAGRTARPEPCTRAHLAGDAAAIALVDRELAQLGVATTATDPPGLRCRSIDATVIADPRGIAVAIAGGEQRVVGDARIAATWIDSWLRDDLGPASAPTTPLPAPREAPPTGSLVDSVRAAPAQRDGATRAARLSLGVVGERGYASDGGAWNGASANACVRVAGVCLGVRGRAAWQAPTTIDGAAVSRSDYALYATASTLVAAGQMVIGPELGIGAGALTTTRGTLCRSAPPMQCGPGDPTTGPPPPSCEQPPPIVACSDQGALPVPRTANDQRSTVSARAIAGIRIAVPLFAHVWLDGNAGVGIAALGRAAAGMPNAAGDIRGLPADPLATFSIGLGLRIGGDAP